MLRGWPRSASWPTSGSVTALPESRVRNAGYTASTDAENVAWNEPDTVSVMTAWLTSPGHQANIMGPYSDFGGAMAQGKNGPYWCTVFGAPT